MIYLLLLKDVPFFHPSGYEVYLVGGCVRDLILKRTPKDFDIITSAELKEVIIHFHLMVYWDAHYLEICIRLMFDVGAQCIGLSGFHFTTCIYFVVDTV